MSLFSVFFSFAIIVCAQTAMCQDTPQIGADERCGICRPQSQPTGTPDESDQTKCGCGRPKKRDALDCGCGRPKKSSDLECGCGRPKKRSSDLDCGCGRPKKRSDVEDLEVCKACGICRPQQQPQGEPADQETKKVDAEKVLEGIASACVHAGAVAGAQTKREQKQAACNLVGSIFHLAAQVAKKEAKNTEDQARCVEQISGDLEKNQFVDKPYLLALSSIDDTVQRNEAIYTIIDSPENCQIFLGELFATVREYVKAHKPDLHEEFDKTLERIAEKSDEVA